jgi:DNA-binding NarL/FixJ family response regulator
MPRPRPVVLLIDPANRLDPLLADHPLLGDVLIIQVTGPSDRLAAAAVEHIRAHQPVAVVFDFTAPYEPSWDLLVRVREADPMAGRPIIFTTDGPTARAVVRGVPFGVTQLALVVQPDGTGVATLVERILDSLAHGMGGT